MTDLLDRMLEAPRDADAARRQFRRAVGSILVGMSLGFIVMFWLLLSVPEAGSAPFLAILGGTGALAIMQGFAALDAKHSYHRLRLESNQR